MTEGGGSCILEAHNFPDKLHTVGKPAEGHDMRVIDEDERELPPATVGEVVGRSAIDDDRLSQPAAARRARPSGTTRDGNRFIRTGDVGRFDEDGFLTLMDRRKDMVISGGFNIYPSDLEAVLRQHPAWPMRPWSACRRRSGARRRWPSSCRTPDAPPEAEPARLGQRASSARPSAWPTCATSTSCRAATSARC